MGVQVPDSTELTDQFKWPAKLAELTEVIGSALVRSGRKPNDAWKDAQVAVLAVAEYQGGQLFYIPRGDRIKTVLRDQEIYRRMGKEKPEDLAAEYRLSVTRIYTIAAQQRNLQRKRREELRQAGKLP